MRQPRCQHPTHVPTLMEQISWKRTTQSDQSGHVNTAHTSFNKVPVSDCPSFKPYAADLRENQPTRNRQAPRVLVSNFLLTPVNSTAHKIERKKETEEESRRKETEKKEKKEKKKKKKKKKLPVTNKIEM